MKIWIGIDPSHETFDAAFPHSGKTEHYETRKYEQSEAGFVTFLSDLPADASVVIEETGCYSIRLLHWLHQQRVEVYVASSRQIAGFRQMIGSRAKNDAQDAIAIARFGATGNAKRWHPPKPFLAELRQLLALEAGLVKYRTALKNQRHAFKLEVMEESVALNLLKQLIDNVTAQITQIGKEIKKLIDQFTPNEARLIQSIPGIGPRSTPVIIALMQDVNRFGSARQFAAFLGLTPTTFQSGKSVRRKPKISKVGPAYMRKLLYMAASSAIRYNQPCKTFYERLLKQGKNRHSAIMAVAHKLARMAFAVVKNQTPFDPKFSQKTCLGT